MNAIAVALFGQLSSDSALTTKLGGTKIYDLKIPQGIALPAVRFFYSGGGEENLTPTRSVNTVYAVIAVSEVSMKQAGEIAALIDTALHGTTLTIAGWNNFWTMREGLIEYYELGEGGEDRWHCGAYYRCRLDKSG